LSKDNAAAVVIENCVPARDLVKCRDHGLTADEARKMNGRIILTSGRQLEFTHVKLFNALHIHSLQRLMETAEAKLKEFSSPDKARVSFNSVVMVLVANMLAESAVTKNLSDEARTILQLYDDLQTKIRQSGHLVPVDLIDGVERPMPTLWRATVESQISDRAGSHVIRVPYVHNGDPYVVIGNEDYQTAILWDKVEQYEVA
jgi:hypothetical protein